MLVGFDIICFGRECLGFDVDGFFGGCVGSGVFLVWFWDIFDGDVVGYIIWVFKVYCVIDVRIVICVGRVIWIISCGIFLERGEDGVDNVFVFLIRVVLDVVVFNVLDVFEVKLLSEVIFGFVGSVGYVEGECDVFEVVWRGFVEGLGVVDESKVILWGNDC